MNRPENDCFGGGGVDGALLSVDEVLRQLHSRVTQVAAIETVSLTAAVGRILATDQKSILAVPPFDNSAVDGWAVFTDDLSPGETSRLPVGGRIAAGHILDHPAQPGRAYRIFTGAPLPAGPNAVLMQEDCREDGDFVILPERPNPGANVRRAGESVAIGDVPLKAGTRLGPQHAGVAATIGLTTLPVRCPLRVALFSTGDELRPPGQPLTPGTIHDANRVILSGLLTGLGCQVTDLGILPDRLEAIRDALSAIKSTHDLIVTSGGMSVGEEDHVKAAVTALGRLHLWRVALKPGKPIALGQVGGVPFLGLPGNPVSVLVSFLLFGRPLIAALYGAAYAAPRRYPLPAAFTLAKTAGRREFARARITDTPFGPTVDLLPSDSSGVLTSVTAADGLIDLPESAITIQPGDPVSFLPLSELIP
jgi:molybdopterin molybdotransferase